MKWCNICKEFRSDLWQHMHQCVQKFKREPEKGKWCDICKRFYKRIGQHIRDKHEPVYHPCDQCVKKFKRKGDMVRHKRTVHSVKREEEILQDMEKREEYNFPCEICRKRFRTRELLNKHVDGCHPTKYYKCRECVKVFARKGGLRVHRKISHEPFVYERRCGDGRESWRLAVDLCIPFAVMPKEDVENIKLYQHYLETRRKRYDD